MKKRHIWIMLLCCLLPIFGLAAVYLFKLTVNTVVYFGVILLCPLAHFFMMGQMRRNHDGGHNNQHVHMEVEDEK